MGNTYLKHKSLPKYTMAATDQDVVEVEHDTSGAGEERYAV